MYFFIENIIRLIIMAGLLLCSGFFSASETAFFHLSPRKINSFAASGHRFEKLVWQVLRHPNRLLSSLLFCNMLVNISYFSIAGTMTAKIQETFNPAIASIWATFVFILLLIFGEMMPKAIAYSNTYAMSMIAALPFYMIVKFLSPVLGLLDILIVKPAVRLSMPPEEPTPDNTTSVNQLRIVMEKSARRGLISQSENKILLEVLELGFLKVRHIMRPRVEVPSSHIKTSLQEIRRIMAEADLRYIPVYTESIDSVVGALDFRDILIYPESTAEKLVRPVVFIPEQKSVESLIAFFREKDIDIALVVDEYGGIAGMVQLDDMFEQLLGSQEGSAQEEPVCQLGPMTYRLSARLSIRDWAEAFGVDPEQFRMATIGGLVTALLGRIPKAGDIVTWENMKFIVEHTQKHRVESLILTLEPLTKKE